MQGFIAGMKTAQKAAEDFANRTAKFASENEEHFDRVGKASAVMGGVLLAGFGLAVKSFMEFDSAMAEVRASTHETAGNMDLLREAAVNAGADTAFSAAEAAKGIDELAKAGVSTKDILGGGLTGALSLAAAGSLEVAEAAEISASALTQFKLSGDKVPHLADLLAAGAGKAQGSVKDLGAALNQTGLVAASTGLSIEETTGGLAAFASAGLLGSDAGTSMKTMLQRLTPQSKEAEEKMRELGISAYDAQGQFIGLSKFAGNLKDSMHEMTPEARNAAMAVIFGSDAVRAANVLYEQGSTGIAEWTEKVNDAGYAAVTASIKQDTLAGDLEKLGGSFDSVLIKGGGAAAETLRGIVQGAEDLIDAVGKIPAPVLNAAAGIAGVAGGAMLLGGAFLTVLPRLVEFNSSLDQIAPKGSKARGAITGVGKAAGIAAVALVGLQIAGAVFSDKQTQSAEDFGQALLKVQKIAGNDAGTGLDSMFKDWDKLITGESVSTVNDLSSAVERLTKQGSRDWIDQNIADPLNRMLGFSVSDVAQIEERFKGLGESMGEVTRNGGAETAAKSFQALTAEFQKNGKGAKEALEVVPGYKDALKGLANQAGVTLSEQELLDFAMGKVPASMKSAAAAVDTYTSSTGEAAPVTEEMAKALEDVGLTAAGAVSNLDAFTKSLFAAGLLSLSSSDAAIAYQDSIDKMTESVTKNGKTLDLNTEQGRANQSSYNDLAKSAMAVAEAQAAETMAAKGSSAAQAELQTSLSTSYTSLVTAANQLGIYGTAAEDMARKALGIPKDIPIKAWVEDHATTSLDAIKGKADALNGKVSTLTIQTIQETYNRVINGGPDPARPGQIAPMAGGGAVVGPGAKGVDSELRLLAPGEHVLTDSEVDAMGGQAAVYSFRAQLQSGQSPMGYQYAPAGAPVSRASSVAAPVSAGASVSLELNVHGTTAPREVADEAMGMIRFELQKQGVRLGG